MSECPFLLRISNDTFEYFAGHGYVNAGGSNERVMPPHHFDSLHLSPAGPVEDENGKIIGWKFKNCETKEYHDVFPGKVYNISVWTSAIDDDGRPEDICIDFYLQLIPNE